MQTLSPCEVLNCSYASAHKHTRLARDDDCLVLLLREHVAEGGLGDRKHVRRHLVRVAANVLEEANGKKKVVKNRRGTKISAKYPRGKFCDADMCFCPFFFFFTCSMTDGSYSGRRLNGFTEMSTGPMYV